LAIVLRRLRNYYRLLRLLERWLGLLRPATLLTATLLSIVLLPADWRLRNHCRLRRLLDLRRSLRLLSHLLSILLTERLPFALRIYLTDLTTAA